MITRLTLLTLTLALFTGACTDDKNETETGDSTGSEPTSTTGSEPTSTTGTSDPSDTTSVPGTTTGEPGDTGSEPTTGGEQGGTGEVPPELLPQCEVLCDKAVTCGLVPENEGCAEGCSEQYASDTAECAALASTYLDCMAGLTCAELFDENACADAEGAWAAACDGFVDTCSVGYGGTPDECSFEIDCIEEPLLKMSCDTETCTCFVGEQPMGTCAAEAICEDVDGLEMKAEACCQF